MENITSSPVNLDDLINPIQTLDVVLTFAASSLSIFGSLAIFFTHYRARRNNIYQTFEEPRQMLLCLTFADMMNAIGLLIGVIRFLNSEDKTNGRVYACHKNEPGGCIAQSFVTTWFSTSSFFWTTFIAFHLYWTYNSCNGGNRKLRTVMYHVIGWGGPAVITVIAAGNRVLGSDLSVGSGAWCWISACLDHNERTLWMTMSSKGWEILMYFACLAFYMLLKIKIKTGQRRTQGNITIYELPRARTISVYLDHTTALGQSIYRDIALNISNHCRRDRPLQLQIRQQNENVQQSQSEEVNLDTHTDWRFLLLWLIEVVLRMSGTIRYLTATVKRHTNYELGKYYDCADKVFLHFQSAGDGSQAFCTFLLFCIFDREMRAILRHPCRIYNPESENLIKA